MGVDLDHELITFFTSREKAIRHVSGGDELWERRALLHCRFVDALYALRPGASRRRRGP
jgi:hypothetical protein